MRHLVRRALLAGLFAVFSIGHAHASVLWDWAFLDSNELFSPGEKVVLHARLFNNSNDGETIGDSVSGSDATIAGLRGHAIPFYSFNIGPENGTAFETFMAPLAAGSLRDFIVGREIPAGIVPPGKNTQAVGIDLRSGFEEGAPLISSVVRDFGSKADGHPRQVVPEPSTLALMALGCVATFLKKKSDA